MSFQIGDVVFLKDQPERKMTVSRIYHRLDLAQSVEILCVWFEESKLHENWFSSLELSKVDSGSTQS